MNKVVKLKTTNDAYQINNLDVNINLNVPFKLTATTTNLNLLPLKI